MSGSDRSPKPTQLRPHGIVDRSRLAARAVKAPTGCLSVLGREARELSPRRRRVPRLMTARRRRQFNTYAVAGSSRGRSRLSALTLNTLMDNAPTFAERIVALRQCAVALRGAAELVMSEVQRMDAAQERFMQRAEKSARKEKAGR